MISSNLLAAASVVVYKFVVDQVPFSETIALESFGWAIGGLILFALIPDVKAGFMSTIKTVSKTAIYFVIFNEILYILSKFFTYFASSIGSVSLVSVLSGTQVLFGIILAVIFTRLLPKIFKERFSLKSIAYKFFLFAIMMVGMYLIS